jgi:hypothetical protein
LGELESTGAPLLKKKVNDMAYDLPAARSKTVHDIALEVFVAAMGHQLRSRDAEAAAIAAYEVAKIFIEKRKAEGGG